VCYFEDAIPIGIRRCKDGKIILNPGEEVIIEEGDSVIVIAEDEDTYKAMDEAAFLSKAWTPRMRKSEALKVLPRGKENILFCGWRRDMEDMITLLDE
jgi:hypothetical protein